MTHLFHDLLGLAIATPIAAAILVLPGFGLAAVLERVGLAIETDAQRIGWALLLAVTLPPAIDAPLLRIGGIEAVLALHGVAALASLPALARLRVEVPRWTVAAVAIWWGLIALSFVDVDIDGKLHQSLLIYDLVKHAAVVETLAVEGLPLRDLFFARAEPAGYYYYFYIWGAAVRRLGGGDLVDARMAFAATAFWIGVAFPAVAWRLAREAGLIRRGRGVRFLAVAILLALPTGLDLPMMLGRAIFSGEVESQIEWGSDEIRFALTSAMWVPHHLSATIAAFTALVLLRRAETADPRTRAILVATTGVAFASTFGMSVWIMIGVVPVLVVMVLDDLRRGRVFLLAALAVAGVIALGLALPQILDLTRGRGGDGFPITLRVRAFSQLAQHDGEHALLSGLVLAVLLPLNYIVSFGVFGLGAAVHLTHHRAVGSPAVFQRRLIIAAAVAAIFAGFFASTIINNDLGWRVIWLAELPALVWTAAVMQSMPRPIRPSPAWVVMIAIGLAGQAWDLAGIRFIRLPWTGSSAWINGETADDHAQRAAWEWAARRLPRTAVLQHDPGREQRVFDFGLYGRQRVGVADGEANLFGASKAEVARRIAAVRPIFVEVLPVERIVAIARAEGIDHLVFSAQDPVWRLTGGPPAGLACVYRSSGMCIAPVGPETKGSSH